MDIDEAVRSVKEIMDNWETIELDDYDSLLYRCLAVLLQAHEQDRAEVARLREALKTMYLHAEHKQRCYDCDLCDSGWRTTQRLYRETLAPQAEAGKEG